MPDDINEKTAKKNIEELSKKLATEEADNFEKLKKQAFDAFVALKETDKSDKAKYNSSMLTYKSMLEILMNQYKAELGNNASDLAPIFNKLSEYININRRTMTLNSMHAEQILFSQALDMLNRYSEKIINDINSGKGADLADSDLLDKKMLMVANLTHFMEVTAKGELKPPKDGVHIDATSKKVNIKNVQNDINISKKNIPVFSHDPSFEDIKQGQIGDCYFLSGLSEIAAIMPDKIREAIVDNDDGTVTVRLYGRGPKDLKNPDAPAPLIPVYVTIDKVVPQTTGAIRNLWVQMFERAYVASGFRYGTEESGDIMPENINELYEYYKAHPEKTPSYFQCPWLVNPDGTLHKWEPNYLSIESGVPDEAMELLLGEDYKATAIKIKSYLESVKEEQPKHPTNNQIWKTTLKTLLSKNPQWKNKGNFLDYSENSKGNTYEIFLPMVEYISGQEYIPEEKINKTQPLSQRQFARAIPIEWQDLCTGLSMYFDMVSVPSTDKSLGAHIGDKLDRLCQDIENKDYSTLFQFLDAEEKEKILNTDGAMDRIKEIAQSLKKTATSFIAKADHVKYSGNYKHSEDMLWDKLTNLKNAGCLMAAGSSSDATLNGISAGHAYSLVDLYTKDVGGKTLRFVKLRNPWGQSVTANTSYQTDENGNLAPVQSDNNISLQGPVTDGTFELEFSDFNEQFARISLAGKQNYIEEFNKKDPSVTLDKNSALEYAKIIQSIDEELKATDGFWTKDSEEYKNFSGLLTSLRARCGKYYSNKAENPFIQLVFYDEAEKYLEHCEQKKLTSNTRRDKRIQIAKAFVHLQKIANNKAFYKNPKGELKHYIAEKLYSAMEHVITTQKDGQQKVNLPLFQANKQNYIDAVLKHPKFNSIMDSASYVKACSFADQKPEELLSTFNMVKLKSSEVLKEKSIEDSKKEIARD